MQGRNPGIWIAAAVLLAVLVVAISVPRRPPAAAPSREVKNEAAVPVTPTKPNLPKPAASPSAETPVPASPPTASTPITAPPKASVPPPKPVAAPPPVIAPAPARVEAAPVIVARSAAVQAVDNVHFALRDYRAALGGNPEGTNAEITSALLGRNLKQVRMDLPEGSRVSEKGELCDPWGTPYFFHQLSAQKMEIRSAGPDLTMWTGDDIQM